MSVTVRCYAKINLVLDILGRRDDGYHQIKMVMQSVSIHDTVTVSLNGDAENGIEIACSNDRIPLDESNIAYKAAEAFFANTGIPRVGIFIKIKKRIPVAAGLAGGSADAAGVLLALNELFETRMSRQELGEIGLVVGADVPFCVMGGTVLAEGTGGILSPLLDMPECFIVLAKPWGRVSTAKAYRQFDSQQDPRHPNVEHMISAVCERDLEAIGRTLGNVFEEAMPLESLEEVKEVMRKYNPLGCCMSGTGPTVYAIFEDKGDAEHCASELRSLTEFTAVCVPESKGCVVD